MKVKIKNKIEQGKWWSSLAGKYIEVDSPGPMGYRMLPIIDDNEFYIPSNIVEKVIPSGVPVLSIGIELLDGICNPEQHGDWIDLKVSEDIDLNAKQFMEIPLGVKIAIPDGYEAHVLPRSSAFKKWNIILVNSTGIIDNAYGGEWKFPALAMLPTHIPKGTRIAQFRIMKKQPDINFYKTIVKLEGKNRDGLGSTGN